MKLTGNFYLENEKIAFLFVVLDFGKKNIYLQYKNKIYDLRYLINKIKDKKIFFLIKLYYENKIFETHIKKVIESTEYKKKFFKFFELIIEIEFVNSNFSLVISKIIEIEPDFDEKKNTFLIYAVLANKIILKYNEKIEILYKKSKIELGYYNSDFSKVFKLLGTYVELQKGYKILQISNIVNSNCFGLKREKTIENFEKSGFFKRNNDEIVENWIKDETFEKVREKFDGILEDEIIKELLNF
ncbi:hypothetical protein AB8B22_01640 [Leptotrichia sp. HSP-334]|jgi:hypothetical protein|uniref:Uncharacterized protein n=1 Tax=Leptotrichia rugosa TaxID=3239302 RepID=A0AB39VJ19_9FUSO|nr:hypothetical protein [Leptotrichia sp. oral taxon 498]ASQ47785.1 hypothetical protein BCB68_01655 [Leptotrichia sp. oral taxon 498]